MILSILVLLLLSLSGPAWSSIASAGDGGDGATPPSTAGCDLLLDGGWLVRSLAGPWLWLSCSSRTTTTAATTTTTTTAAASIITAKEAPLLPSASALLLLEPIVTLRTGVLPRNACESLIALGEKASFPHEGESIDEYQDRDYKVSSQSIEVYEREKGITSPAIWEALLPWIPTMTQLVKESIDLADDGYNTYYYPDEPGRVPRLDWVFLRKYSPDSDRNSLLVHVDSNMHTLNIALNDDYVGGGLMYVKPPVSLGFDPSDGRPNIPREYQDYRWLNGVRRGSTPDDIVFPNMSAGDVLIHNFTVWHAVAPIESGSRYSFVLFYDMDNPAIQRTDFDDAIGDDDAGGGVEKKGAGGEMRASFYHEISDVGIDLLYVGKEEDDDDDGKNEAEAIVVSRGVPPFENLRMNTWVGHKFRAVVSGEGTVVSEFVMKAGRREYRIRWVEEG